MIETPRILATEAQHTAVIRLTIPREDIRQVMGPAIGDVLSAVAAQGATPAGPVFSHHLRMDPAFFDFEVGVPVAAPVQPAGRVQPGLLPPATVARTVYHGPYEGLASAWTQLHAWLEQEGHAPAENLWECYETGPESGADPSKWRTQLNRPIAGAAR